MERVSSQRKDKEHDGPHNVPHGVPGGKSNHIGYAFLANWF